MGISLDVARPNYEMTMPDGSIRKTNMPLCLIKDDLASLIDIDGLSMSMSNSNGQALFTALGYILSEDGCGIITDMDELITRCNRLIDIHKAIPELDAAKEMREVNSSIFHQGLENVVVYDMGRREGYFTESATRLRDMAQHANSLDCIIVYC